MRRSSHWSRIGQVKLAEKLNAKPTIYRRKASQFDGLRKCIFGFCDKPIMVGDTIKSLGRNSDNPIAHTDCINRVLNQTTSAANAAALDTLAKNAEASQAAKTAVFVEPEWSPATNEQTIGRLERALGRAGVQSATIDSKPDKLEIKIGNIEITISFKE